MEQIEEKPVWSVTTVHNSMLQLWIILPDTGKILVTHCHHDKK